MSDTRITKEQARQFIIIYQGIGSGYEFRGKQGAMDFIKRVGCIQFDTLNVVGRNSDLVLQSRIKNYRSSMLQELLYKDRCLLDEWDKEMSIYPRSDWPYFGRNRQAAYKRYAEIPAIKDFLPAVRKVLAERGPITSSDLGHNEIIDWSWAPTSLSRATLESMYLWGELIVSNKVNARKSYDFAYKHISEEILNAEDPNKTMQQYHDWNILRRIGAVGLLWNKASDAWLGIKELKAKERNEAIQRLLDKGLIKAIEVEGLKYPLYIQTQYEQLLNTVLEKKQKSRSAVLAPLDNMLWDRKLIKELFDFEYSWEVYKPANQRKYGYYVLPVLCDNRFVARFEPVLDKNTNTLVIKNWWWEPEVKVTSKMLKELKQCIEQFASFTEAEGIAINNEGSAEGVLSWLVE